MIGRDALAEEAVQTLELKKTDLSIRYVFYRVNQYPTLLNTLG